MASVILQWLITNAPNIAVTILIGFIVWQIAKTYFTRFKPMETNVKALVGTSNCVRHESDILELKSMVRNIERILLKSDSTLMDQLSLTRSPRQLSDSGLKLFSESGCKKLLLENGEYYLKKLEDRKPLTALDVETESHSVLLLLSDEKLFYPIKDFLYKNPKFNGIDIDLNALCFVMGLELRNEYLKKHPEISVD